MPMLTDLSELKKYLEISVDDHSEDANILLYIDVATNWIEEILGRTGLFYKQRTEYYPGTGTQKLLLKSRPVFTTPTIQCFVDEAGYFGSTSGAFDAQNTQLTYGDDFCLQIDQDDGTSRSAILVRIGDYWPQPYVRSRGYLSPFEGGAFGNVKVVYSAGYTVDSLPAVFRAAANVLVAGIRYVMPLGMPLASESYEERSMTILVDRKGYLTGLVKPLISSYRNWNF